MAEIKRRFSRDKAGMLENEYIEPKVETSPRDAFYGKQKSVPISESAGKVSCEFVMCYPPGIPMLAPGELITPEILDHIKYSKERGCMMTGTEDMNIERIKIMDI